MAYVDGFVLPLPRKNLDAYRELAKMAAEVWKDHGALEYRECVGEDLDIAEMGPRFPAALDASDEETVVFAWILYESREHRDQVNARAMEDPRLDSVGAMMPFDSKRMLYGGFETLVAG